MFNRLREDMRAVFERDPAARTNWEVFTCYPGLHALIFHRWAHRLWRARLKWLARFVAYFGRSITGVEIHPAAKIGQGVFIDHGMGSVIGETAEVGDGCTLYHGVTLGGTAWRNGKRHPTLGCGVVVGAGAKILGPIVVGAGARIGCNAVVLKDVRAGASVIGNPARVIEATLGQSEPKFRPYAVTDEVPDSKCNEPVRMTAAGPMPSEREDELAHRIEGVMHQLDELEQKLTERRLQVASVRSASSIGRPQKVAQ